MTAKLFQAWLEHYKKAIKDTVGTKNRHMLILDGHRSHVSHVSLEMVAKAYDAGIDIITLPAHTSHKLQPLDVSVFKSLKVQFRKERYIWQHKTASRQASKTELASSVAKAMCNSLTEANIKAGFCATGIRPLDPAAKFEGMPCNHINIVEETTNTINEDVSQVLTTPMAAAIEDEAIIALNNMASQLNTEEPPITQHNGPTHGMSFTNLMDIDEISDYVDILARSNERLVEPLVFTRSYQGDHAGYEQSPSHLSRLPSTPMQTLDQQQREVLDENVNPILNNKERASQESNQISQSLFK
ncbi:hypothetical protein L7F22_041872 [Adiantum nelumboides]|nr:hypothetical protein [Adiantum nelumboides]